MTYELQNTLDLIVNKLDCVIDLLKINSPKTSKQLLTEYFNEISTCSGYRDLSKTTESLSSLTTNDMLYVDPNFTNNDVGLPGGTSEYTTESQCGDKLCTCGK